MDNLYIVKEFNENSTIFSYVIDGKSFEKTVEKNLSEVLNISDVITKETLLTLEKI